MQKNEDITSLVWFRNDLRTLDNSVLYEACKNSNTVIGIYCLDPRHYESTAYGFKKTEKYRSQFLLESLSDLKANLDTLNIDLLVYQNQPEAIIPEVCETYNITDIYLQNEWTTEEVTKENNLKDK